jgi:hypothetical protein
MRRHIIGMVAVVSLVTWLAMQCGAAPAAGQQIAGIAVRFGALMAAWWLAYPDLVRLPRWLWAAMPIAVVVLVKWPQLFWAVIPILLLVAMLKGSQKSKGKRQK